MSKTYFRSGNTAVITGASSGIGRAAAIQCASMGMNVFLVDIDEAELLLATELALAKAKDEQTVESAVVDVSNQSAVEALAKKVFSTEEGTGKCHVLMNNAGIGGGGGATASPEVYHKTMNVNTFGPIHGCVAFLPLMRASGEDCLIVNTGSKQGITMPPGNLVYNVSKAALKAYTEGLEHELDKERQESGGKCRAALLIPGWVNTSIMLKNVRAKAEAAGEEFDVSKVFFHEGKPADGAWMPTQVVEFMLEELDKDRFYIVCPDNDVDRHTDNLRMTWTMQDITEDRRPLSRWHPDHKDAFAAYLQENKKKD